MKMDTAIPLPGSVLHKKGESKDKREGRGRRENGGRGTSVGLVVVGCCGFPCACVFEVFMETILGFPEKGLMMCINLVRELVIGEHKVGERFRMPDNTIVTVTAVDAHTKDWKEHTLTLTDGKEEKTYGIPYWTIRRSQEAIKLCS